MGTNFRWPTRENAVQWAQSLQTGILFIGHDQYIRQASLNSFAEQANRHRLRRIPDFLHFIEVPDMSLSDPMPTIVPAKSCPT